MCAHTHGSYGYCHWVTGKYWLDLNPNDLHWNISDTGWAKSAWSNVFAPWSQAAGVFVHDMPRFEAKSVLNETKSGNRFIAPVNEYNEVMKENNDPLDPHIVFGQPQTRENGFNNLWCDYSCIIRLLEMCKDYLQTVKGR